MKTWDVVIIGGGIMGLSLAIALRKRSRSVLVVERGEPGREASYAAAGMVADCSPDLAAPLRSLAGASARMYPEFVHELQDESGVNVDLRNQGTLLIANPRHVGEGEFNALTAAQLREMEPALKVSEFSIQMPSFYSNQAEAIPVSESSSLLPVFYLPERSVDPRELIAAALKAARHREVDISSGATVTEVLFAGDQVIGVATDRTSYKAPIVVNCAGAWVGEIAPVQIPTRPVKGQMLAVVGGPKLQHVIRWGEGYVVPRTDGRVIIGATVEEAGYNKRTDPDSIQGLLHAAIRFVPGLAKARVLEAWAGLRPGTPDDLPILGETQTHGYFVAAGHFRDGILLAPITARLMAQAVTGEQPEHDLSAFSPRRFSTAAAAV